MAHASTGSSASPDIPYMGNWDPMTLMNEKPTPSCLLRVAQEIADIEASLLQGIFVSTEASDGTKVHAVVVGPEGTPYEGGFFHFFIKCPANYPFVPPRVRLMNTDDGRVCFSPRLYACGKVCLSVLGTWPGPPWSPIQNIGSVLISIQSLMNEQTFYDEPATTTQTPLSSVKRKDRVRHDTVRVAVCDFVEACLRDQPPYPPYLVGQILKTFAESYDKYEERVNALAELDGSRRLSQMLGLTTTQIYEPLLSRLRQLGQRVKENM